MLEFIRSYIVGNMESMEDIDKRTWEHLESVRATADKKRERKLREKNVYDGFDEDAPARWYDSMLRDLEFVGTYTRSRFAHAVNRRITPESLNKSMEASIAAADEADASK